MSDTQDESPEGLADALQGLSVQEPRRSPRPLKLVVHRRSCYFVDQSSRCSHASDIIVHAFGYKYQLYRQILARLPYFAKALDERWLASKAKKIKFAPEKCDQRITRYAFELVLKRLYTGVPVTEAERQHAFAVLATASYLGFDDLLASSAQVICDQMKVEDLADVIKFVSESNYGPPGAKILAHIKALLCRRGCTMSEQHWDAVPPTMLAEIISSDVFFVEDEWHRWLLVERLLNYRLRRLIIDSPKPGQPELWSLQSPEYARDAMAVRMTEQRGLQHQLDGGKEWLLVYTEPTITALLEVLDHGIHYMHMDFEKLDKIRFARDICGQLLLKDETAANAIWKQADFRHLLKHVDLLEARRYEFYSHAQERSHLQFETASVLARTPVDDIYRVLDNKNSYGTFPLSPIALVESQVDCDHGGRLKLSRLLPMRFGVTLPWTQLDFLERVHSRHFFYAGAIWSVYLQNVGVVKGIDSLRLGIRRCLRHSKDTHYASAEKTDDLDYCQQRIISLQHSQLSNKNEHWQDMRPRIPPMKGTPVKYNNEDRADAAGQPESMDYVNDRSCLSLYLKLYISAPGGTGLYERQVTPTPYIFSPSGYCEHLMFSLASTAENTHDPYLVRFHACWGGYDRPLHQTRIDTSLMDDDLKVVVVLGVV